MPLVIWVNIEFRNTASKSCAWPFALACACGETFVSASCSRRSGRPRVKVVGAFVNAG